MSRKFALLGMATMILIGCGSPDERLAEMADRVVMEQSQQNARASQQTQQIAEASRQLVEADAHARQDMIAAHERLQSEVGQQRLIVDRQRDVLEAERRQIATDRQREPVVAGAISGAGLLIALLLPLVLAIYLLRYLATSPEPSHELMQLLSEQLVSEEQLPRLSQERLSGRITDQT